METELMYVQNLLDVVFEYEWFDTLINSGFTLMGWEGLSGLTALIVKKGSRFLKAPFILNPIIIAGIATWFLKDIVVEDTIQILAMLLTIDVIIAMFLAGFILFGFLLMIKWGLARLLWPKLKG